MATTSAQQPKATDIETIRKTGLQRIEDTRIAGPGTGHMRDQNLLAVQKFVDDDPHCAWNYPDASDFAFDQVLDMISRLTGCSSDPGHRVGDGYISPQKTLDGFERAADRIAGVARRGGSFLLATGHPGSLLSYYLGIAGMIEELGGRMITPNPGEHLSGKLHLDYVGPVAVVTNLSSLPHTHEFDQMEVALATGERPDMVVADHGFAGVAIEAGIPTVAVMDTNDPALAVWKHQGADLTIIPMDDNRTLSAYLPHVQTMRSFTGLD